MGQCVGLIRQDLATDLSSPYRTGRSGYHDGGIRRSYRRAAGRTKQAIIGYWGKRGCCSVGPLGLASLALSAWLAVRGNPSGCSGLRFVASGSTSGSATRGSNRRPHWRGGDLQQKRTSSSKPIFHGFGGGVPRAHDKIPGDPQLAWRCLISMVAGSGWSWVSTGARRLPWRLRCPVRR